MSYDGSDHAKREGRRRRGRADEGVYEGKKNPKEKKSGKDGNTRQAISSAHGPCQEYRRINYCWAGSKW